MKKFYLSLFALICTVAFNASAIECKKSANAVKSKSFETVAETVPATTLKKLSKKAPASRAAFTSLEDLVGDYSWMGFNLLSENNDVVGYDVEISIFDETTNTLLIEGLYGGARLYGVADLAAGTITIAPVKIGYADKWQEDMIFVVCEDENDIIVPTENDLVLTYTVTEDGAAFVSQSIYGVVGRTADGTYTHADGYYYLNEVAVVQLVASWDFLGTGTVSGDVLYSSFGVSDFVDYETEVYVSKEDPNVYKVKDFLKGLYAALNFTSVSPSYTFDATDANNVSMLFQETGIYGGTTDGYYYFLSMNQNYENIEDCPAANRGTLTLTDNMVVISFPSRSTLLYASTSNKLYYANPEPFTITVKKESGVENIAVEDANAPAEFFNLQGQRVAAPVKGNFYIKRQGTTTSKVVF